MPTLEVSCSNWQLAFARFEMEVGLVACRDLLLHFIQSAFVREEVLSQRLLQTQDMNRLNRLRYNLPKQPAHGRAPPTNPGSSMV